METTENKKKDKNWLGLEFSDSISNIEYGDLYKEGILDYIEYLKEEALRKLDEELACRWSCITRFEDRLVPTNSMTEEMKRFNKEKADKERGYAFECYYETYKGVEYRYEFQKGKYKNGNLALKIVCTNNRNDETNEYIITQQIARKLEYNDALINIDYDLRRELRRRGMKETNKSIIKSIEVPYNPYSNIKEYDLVTFSSEFLDSIESFEEIIPDDGWDIIEDNRGVRILHKESYDAYIKKCKEEQEKRLREQEEKRRREREEYERGVKATKELIANSPYVDSWQVDDLYDAYISKCRRNNRAYTVREFMVTEEASNIINYIPD